LTRRLDIGKLFFVVINRNKHYDSNEISLLKNFKKGLTVCLILDIVVNVVENNYSIDSDNFDIYSKSCLKID